MIYEMSNSILACSYGRPGAGVMYNPWGLVQRKCFSIWGVTIDVDF